MRDHRQVLESIARKEAWSRELSDHTDTHGRIDGAAAAAIRDRHNPPRPDPSPTAAPDPEVVGPGDGGVRTAQPVSAPASDGLDPLRQQIARAEQSGDWTAAMGLKDELSLGLASYAEEQRRGPYA